MLSSLFPNKFLSLVVDIVIAVLVYFLIVWALGALALGLPAIVFLCIKILLVVYIFTRLLTLFR